MQMTPIHFPEDVLSLKKKNTRNRRSVRGRLLSKRCQSEDGPRAAPYGGGDRGMRRGLEGEVGGNGGD